MSEGFARFSHVKLNIFKFLLIIALAEPGEKAQATTPSTICGSALYDTQTLTSASYWKVTKPGICYDTWNTTDQCTINLAFCQSLPVERTGGKSGIGASQRNDLVGGTFKILGTENEFVDDISGKQLIATYPNGDLFGCGNIQLIMYLRCNESAYWSTPINGQPSEIPTPVTVELDKHTEGCLYSVYTDYAGACAMEPSPSYLSAGSILIIIFICVMTVYFTGGVVYNKCAGATGNELIPNYEMWYRLPSDIMGGVYFFVSCITCQEGRSSDAYDSI